MNKAERRESLEAQVASFPDAPGVYLFKDTRGRVLYVGKADVLAAEVNRLMRLLARIVPDEDQAALRRADAHRDCRQSAG